MRWNILCPSILIKSETQYIDMKKRKKTIYSAQKDAERQNGRYGFGITVNGIRREKVVNLTYWFMQKKWEWTKVEVDFYCNH